MHTVRTVSADRSQARGSCCVPLLPSAAPLLVCGCNTDQQITGAPEVPTDYRLRHPISIAEKDHTLQLFIGANRGSLTPTQRARAARVRANLEERSHRRRDHRSTGRQQQ